MRIGIDVDGVLANFNDRFISRVIAVTGKDLFPPRPFDIPTWNYPEHYGYTAEETTAVWESVKKDLTFWESLPAYEHAAAAFHAIAAEAYKGHDVYFISSRPGIDTKIQTERWLSRELSDGGNWFPITVLISSEKGLCAKALNLDKYVDDYAENIASVVTLSPTTEAYLFTQPWNRDAEVAFTRISKISEMFA